MSQKGLNTGTNTIKSILINPVYLGITIYNATTLIRDSSGKQKRVVRPQEEWIVRHNTHPPLITLQEYNQIIDIIEHRKKKLCKEWTKEKKYLLSGILYCSICKGKIYGGKQTYSDKSKDFYYYEIKTGTAFAILKPSIGIWKRLIMML